MTNTFEKAKRLHSRGHFIEAQELYAEVIEANIHDADALYLLGTLLGQRGSLDRALTFLERAVIENPKNSVYHCNLGVVQHNLKRLEDAKISFLISISLDLRNVDAHYNLAKLYKDLGLIDQSIGSYEAVLSFDSNHFDACINLGNLFADLGRFDDAIRKFEEANTINPKANRALINLGNAHRRVGLASKAKSYYNRALRISAHDGLKIKSAFTLPVVYNDLVHINEVREQLKKHVKELLEENLEVPNPSLETSTTNFLLAYQNQNDRDLQRDIAQIHLNSCPRLGWTAKHCYGKRSGHKKIKIGFLSSYFWRHSVGRLMVGLISNLPKDLFQLVIITNRGQRDSVAREIEEAADQIVYLSEDLFEMQQEIGRLEIDALIYADIGMDIRSYFLAFSRLAPIQGVFWGHPETTGIPNLDTFFSSSMIEPPDGASHYTEQLFRFSNLPAYYRRPAIPESLKSRVDFGLEEKQRYYFCPQSTIKFHPDVDKIFADILKGDEAGRILLLEGAVANWTFLLKERWTKSMGKLVERIDILPRQTPEDFVSLQSTADVILDTPHFSGGNTTYEAFAVGKPVVTLDSAYMRGRVSSGMYRMMGIKECIAPTIGEYIQIALDLGMNSDFRMSIETQIKEKNDLLFERKEIISEFINYVTNAVS